MMPPWAWRFLAVVVVMAAVDLALWVLKLRYDLKRCAMASDFCRKTLERFEEDGNHGRANPVFITEASRNALEAISMAEKQATWTRRGNVVERKRPKPDAGEDWR